MIALPTVAMGTYFAVHGAWDAFIDANLLANMRHSASAANGALVSFTQAILAWLLHTGPLWAGSGALLTWRARRREAPLLTAREWLCLGWLLVGFLEASVTKQFYRHYYLVTLPPLCLLLTSLAARTEGIHRGRGLGIAMAAAIALTPLSAIGLKYYRPWVSDFIHGRQDESTRVAALVRTLAKPDDTLYVLDAEPVVYFLADIEPATRFAFPAFILDPHFSAVARVDYRVEFSAILSRAPRCIVMLRHNPNPRAQEFRKLIKPVYRPQGSFETVDVRCRNDST
jgi:hypothetical protein